ncbi:hypothetical protein P5673_005684 [Acropora cervicornis]|uniref:Uncharacterized protein n=1 Tax=Acropora cervicornis TaxID=6130 RepID=A0AAD9QYH1_ACRCE|nr:hypothetical protein P5673_005684 [Acropora cervicornis]
MEFAITRLCKSSFLALHVCSVEGLHLNLYFKSPIGVKLAKCTVEHTRQSFNTAVNGSVTPT